MRYILLILSFSFSGLLSAQMYRVFYNDEGEKIKGDASKNLVSVEYIRTIALHCDSVWMTSHWLRYSLIETKKYPSELLQYAFVNRIEEVEPMLSISLQENEKDSVDPETINEHRLWQLDTLGYEYFKDNEIDGNGIVIAIIDAGFTMANESRAFKDIFSSGRVLRTWDFIDNDTTVFDGSNHGTGVWSCIAGNMDGKPTGLATGASFILLRSEDQKTETMADEDRWIQAIEKAYEWGADIVNSSVGFTNVLHSRKEVNGQTLISKAAQIATEKGMLVVVSAGNEWVTAWKTLSIPADAEGVVTVGGIDKEGNHSYFSSVGPTADGRSKPDVVAPGTCVVVKGNEFSIGNGTSYAAPLITGYLACMLQLKGKNNFTKDSLKFYGGLYPYFDHVFGYGVPSGRNTSIVLVGVGYAFQVDKLTSTIKCIPFYGNDPAIKNVFLKIEDGKGKIKFSKKINFPKSGIYKVPISSKEGKFNYSKNYKPQSTDKWTFHYSEFTHEF